jgi:hypothetical protein
VKLPEPGPDYRSFESFGDGGSEFTVVFESLEKGFMALSWYCTLCTKELGVDATCDSAMKEPPGCRFCGGGIEAIAFEEWD